MLELALKIKNRLLLFCLGLWDFRRSGGFAFALTEAENLYLVEYSLVCRSASLRIHLSTLPPRLLVSHPSKPSYKSQHIFIHFLRSRLSDKNCEIPAKFAHKFQFLMEAVMEMAFGRQFGGSISESVTHKLLNFIFGGIPRSKVNESLPVSPSPHRNLHFLRQFTLSSPSSAPLSAKHN